MKTRQFRPATVASIVLGIAGFCLAVAVVNQQFTSSRVSAEIAREQQALARVSRDVATNLTLSRNYQELSTRLGGRYKEVSWSRHLPFMVNQITGTMLARKLKIETLRPDPVKSWDGVSQLPLRLGFKATLGDLAKLTQDIEKTTPLMEIDRLDIRSVGDKSDQLQSDMIISSFAVTDANAPEMKPVKAKYPNAVKAVEKPKAIAKLRKVSKKAPVSALPTAKRIIDAREAMARALAAAESTSTPKKVIQKKPATSKPDEVSQPRGGVR